MDIQLACLTLQSDLFIDNVCGSNGLPVTPNSIRIIGNFKAHIESVTHKNLVKYIDCFRNKNEKITVVFEHYDQNKARQAAQKKILTNVQQQFLCVQQILDGLNELHNVIDTVHGFIDSNSVIWVPPGPELDQELSSDLNEKDCWTLKFTHWAINKLTENGITLESDCLLPKDRRFLAPEQFIRRANTKIAQDQFNQATRKSDIWSSSLLLATLLWPELLSEKFSKSTICTKLSMCDTIEEIFDLLDLKNIIIKNNAHQSCENSSLHTSKLVENLQNNLDDSTKNCPNNDFIITPQQWINFFSRALEPNPENRAALDELYECLNLKSPSILNNSKIAIPGDYSIVSPNASPKRDNENNNEKRASNDHGVSKIENDSEEISASQDVRKSLENLSEHNENDHNSSPNKIYAKYYLSKIDYEPISIWKDNLIECLDVCDLYHLWRLSWGRNFFESDQRFSNSSSASHSSSAASILVSSYHVHELSSHSAINQNLPPIFNVPSLILAERPLFGNLSDNNQRRKNFLAIDTEIISLSLEKLRENLDQMDKLKFYPLILTSQSVDDDSQFIHEHQENFCNNDDHKSKNNFQNQTHDIDENSLTNWEVQRNKHDLKVKVDKDEDKNRDNKLSNKVKKNDKNFSHDIIQGQTKCTTNFYTHTHTSSQSASLNTNTSIGTKDNNNKSNKNEAQQLPLIIREADFTYQCERIILFKRLLAGCPYLNDKLIKEAHIDIPPLYRSQTWAVLLNIRPSDLAIYERIDRTTPSSTDRQISVDIPRCHQYNELMASPQGHLKLAKILRAWLNFNKHEYVYWQGLDSLAAPFLLLNFSNESQAFACFHAFVQKYLRGFFQKDNQFVVQRYLDLFFDLLSHHDAPLADHLDRLGFAPNLYAIPWFLTMFTHVLPLHKILQVWDRLLLGNETFPLCIGLAILAQFRDQLLSYTFNDCIVVFSDLPEIDIERCINDACNFYSITPTELMKRGPQLSNIANKTDDDDRHLIESEMVQINSRNSNHQFISTSSSSFQPTFRTIFSDPDESPPILLPKTASPPFSG